jgi:ABC-type multidrug transport system fused ATPase/permease subunit
MTPERSRGHFWRFVREFVLPHRLVCALLVANVVLQVILGFWLPYAAKEMVDRVLVPGVPDLRLAAWLIISVLGVILATQGLSYLFNRLMLRLVSHLTQRLRTALADRLLALSQSYYDAAQIGRLLMTALGDPSNISQQLTMGMINALAQAIVIFGGCIILFWMNTALSLAVFAVFPLMVLTFLWMRPRLMEISELTRESWGIACAIVNEKVGGIRVVRSFATEELESRRFKERMDIHAGLNIRSSRLNATYGFLNGLCLHLGYMLVFLVGGLMIFRGHTTLGTVVAFYGYFNRLFPAVLQICNLPQQILSAQGSLDKVFGLLDEVPKISNRPGARRFDEPLREIAFESLSFRYGARLPLVLDRLDLAAEAGRQVGLVGPSGAGKSTLMGLLLRYYEPTQGAVLVNGRDIRDWELRSLRLAFGLVPQEQMLFTGSVRENIVYTRGAQSDARIWAALEEAEAAGFVRGLDKGLDSMLGERGVSLSGGQKQRLAIARALLSGPQCLILDNCTSALDAETEQRLQETLRRILAGRSALIISHRASSVLHCGDVWVLDAGRLVERGSAAELLEVPGYFHAIHRQQAGLS